jgi:hypothetical protein
MPSRIRKSPPPHQRSAKHGKWISMTLNLAAQHGLLEGDKTAHVSVRVNPALLDAAKRETGIASTTDLVEYALAYLATPDPVAGIMAETYGDLGPDHRDPRKEAPSFRAGRNCGAAPAPGSYGIVWFLVGLTGLGSGPVS